MAKRKKIKECNGEGEEETRLVQETISYEKFIQMSAMLEIFTTDPKIKAILEENYGLKIDQKVNAGSINDEELSAAKFSANQSETVREPLLKSNKVE